MARVVLLCVQEQPKLEYFCSKRTPNTFEAWERDPVPMLGNVQVGLEVCPSSFCSFDSVLAERRGA